VLFLPPSSSPQSAAHLQRLEPSVRVQAAAPNATPSRRKRSSPRKRGTRSTLKERGTEPQCAAVGQPGSIAMIFLGTVGQRPSISMAFGMQEATVSVLLPTTTTLRAASIPRYFGNYLIVGATKSPLKRGACPTNRRRSRGDRADLPPLGRLFAFLRVITGRHACHDPGQLNARSNRHSGFT
jgi:hypothetical protein